jgi:cell division protein FtsB
VKAAVRYKAAGAAGPETVHSIAFPIDPSHGPAEVLTGAPIQVDEAALAEAPPAGVSYGDLPSFLAVEGAKTLERALRDRLDDAFTIDLLYDPETKSLSRPGEMMEDFALRLRDTPAIQSKRRSLESKLTSKRGQIQDRQEEVKARGMEKWASIGTSILSNASIIFGRKRTVTGVGGVLSKQRMESTARQRIERLQAEVVELEDEISRLSAVDPLRFETRSVKPSRSDVSLIRYDILWVT